MTSFGGKCKFFEPPGKLTNTDLDLIITATCVSNNQYVNSQLTDLTRYEFLEMIVRVADDKYKKTKIVKTIAEGISKVIEELIYPHAVSMDGENFRRYHCYAVKVNEILKKNESQIKKVYASFCH